MIFPRAAGILLHPTSLPGPFGIGDLGPEAHRFLDRLAAAGQRWWQVLPLGPVGAGNSPYQSFSAFAGNPLLISPEQLAEDGLLTKADLAEYPRLPADHVDFGEVIPAKMRLLAKAFDRADLDRLPGYAEFGRSPTMRDFGLFMALKDAHGQQQWDLWELPLSSRDPAALSAFQIQNSRRIEFHCFLQYQFDKQWRSLRDAAKQRGIGLIGDLPIFVARDSVDVWLRPELFQLDAKGDSIAVAGVPPDFFSATGQLWGNPLYDWDAHQAEGFAWWIRRLQAMFQQVDVARVDHFRGFSAYWSIPAGSPTAAEGRWVAGPGDALFSALKSALGELPLIAEDLGVMDDGVVRLREQSGFPGMAILQMAFTGHADDSRFLPHNHTQNSVVYTGTHDNDTVVGWLQGSAGQSTQSDDARSTERSLARRYFGFTDDDVATAFMRWALASVAHTAIIPLQDVLGLDGSARMNVPGTAAGNWEWRVQAHQYDDAAFERLADLTRITGRLAE